MVIEGMGARARGEEDSAPQASSLRLANHFDADIDVVDVDQRDTRHARGTRLAEVRKPAVVGLAALEVVLGRDFAPVLHQTGAEGRHLRKDDLPSAHVVVDLLHANGGVPLAATRCEGIARVAEHREEIFVSGRERRVGHRLHALTALPGLVGVGFHRLLIEEGPHPRHHLPRVGDPPGVGRLVVLRRHVLVVDRGQCPRVTIGADDQDLVGHLDLPVPEFRHVALLLPGRAEGRLGVSRPQRSGSRLTRNAPISAVRVSRS